MGDYNGHVGLGVKCSKEVATAIRGAIVLAKLSIIPVRLGYWGNKIGQPHTVPCKVNTTKINDLHCYNIDCFSLLGDWQVWVCVGASHSGSSWNGDRQCPHTQEVAHHGGRL